MSRLPRSLFLVIPILVLVALLPAVFRNNYQQHLLVMIAINSILALGLNLILGFVGDKSLGHASFFGIGAYIGALIAFRTGGDLILSLIGAVAGAAVMSVLIGYPVLRLRGPYFAIVTLGFSLILQLIASNWISVTGGPMGLPGVPGASLKLGGIVLFKFKTVFDYWWLTFAVALLFFLISWSIERTALGRILTAIRENYNLSEAAGINPFRYKMVAFVLGAGFAGLAGGIYSQYTGYISPKVFDTLLNVNLVTMVIVGGEATTIGPIIGSAIVTLLPELLRFVEGLRMLIFGSILLAVILFAPHGVMGLVKSIIRKTRK